MNQPNTLLYALMIVKIGGHAETSMKSIDHRMGLEAWRSVSEEIGLEDEQSLHVEFIRCADDKQTRKTSDSCPATSSVGRSA